MARSFLFLGALSGLLTVAFGAFGAHALRQHLDTHALEVFHTGVQYQGLHALALFGTGLFALQAGPSRWLQAAGWSFVGGSLLFSGSLYALAITGSRAFAFVTPVGGTLFLIGWLCLSIAALRCSDSGPGGSSTPRK